MKAREKTKIGEFLFEREGKYKPDSEAIAGLKRIDKIDFAGNFHIAQKPSKTNMILICSGDLVISGINVSKGAMGIYHGDEDVTATIHYSSYTFDTSKIDVGYFKRFLKSAEFIRLLQEQVKGGIKTEIKPKHILPMEIYLPDIAEQRKILSHFKSVETEDRDLKSELTYQQNLLKKFRQQILQEAIEGKLTKDWRTENPDIEPANELLKRIQTEKKQLIKNKIIKKPKPLLLISDEEKTFELPKGWAWCRLGELFEIVRGSSPRPKGDPLYWSKNRTLFHWITIADFSPYGKNGVLMDTKGFLTEEGSTKSRQVKEGDLLIACSGVGSVGRSIKTGINGYIYDGLLAIRNISSDYMRALMKLFLTYKEAQIYSVASGANWLNINIEILSNYVFPLPPIPEQKAIVAKVEKLLAVCDELESQITSNQNHAKQLMQAVLKEAFSQSSEQLK